MNRIKKIALTLIIGLFLTLSVGCSVKSADDYYKEENTSQTTSDNKTTTETKEETKKEETNTTEASKSSSTTTKEETKTNSSSSTTSKNETTNNTTKPSTTTSAKPNNNISVYVTIDFTNLIKSPGKDKLKAELKKYVPSSGYLLANATTTVVKDSSVLTALITATKNNGIQMQYIGSANTAYIQGINYIYEFSAGGQSGWMYSVNGTFPNYGLGNYKLKNGDKIRLVYTTNLGCDIGYSISDC